MKASPLSLTSSIYGQPNSPMTVFDNIAQNIAVFEESIANHFGIRVRELAIANILSDNRASRSKVKLTGRLAKSIVVSPYSVSSKRLTVTVGAEYAGVKNQPMGTYTLVTAHGKALKFKSRGRTFYRKAVRVPGTAFFTRAWEQALEELPEFVEGFDITRSSVFSKTPTGRTVYRGGSTPLSTYETRGLVADNGKLTPKGRLRVRITGKLGGNL